MFSSCVASYLLLLTSSKTFFKLSILGCRKDNATCLCLPNKSTNLRHVKFKPKYSTVLDFFLIIKATLVKKKRND